MNSFIHLINQKWQQREWQQKNEMYHNFHKNVKQHTVLNNDNNKHQISILEKILNDHVTLKMQLCHHRNKLHFKMY